MPRSYGSVVRDNYRRMSTEELVERKERGELTAEASIILDSELESRGASIERRFANISHVMILLGEETVDGYKPLSNVGARVKVEIEALIRDRLSRARGRSVNDGADEFERRVLELRLLGLKIDRPAGTTKPEKLTRSVHGFVRSAEVKAYVLQEANGRCEVCSSPAPFKDANGMPFLEVHHVRPLAEGGE